MAGWALRVSDRAASPDSRTSITSQPRISDARTNGQPAGSPAQGGPLLLAMRPWPGKVKAILSTGKASYGEEVTKQTPNGSAPLPAATVTLDGNLVQARQEDACSADRPRG